MLVALQVAARMDSLIKFIMYSLAYFWQNTALS